MGILRFFLGVVSALGANILLLTNISLINEIHFGPRAETVFGVWSVFLGVAGVLWVFYYWLKSKVPPEFAAGFLRGIIALFFTESILYYLAAEYASHWGDGGLRWF